MTAPSTDRPICGFNGLGGICREPRASFACTTHEGERWSVCGGCQNRAFRTCGHADTCTVALCMSCTHRADGVHGPAVAAEPLDADPPRVAAREMREQLCGVIAQTLRELTGRGLLDVKPINDKICSEVVYDAVAASIMVERFSAIARIESM
jgi:hypothetical protein